MEFKKYEKREEPEYKFGVCVCGHYWHRHLIGFLGIFGKSCKKCQCPRYNEIGRFTFQEAQELGVE